MKWRWKYGTLRGTFRASNPDRTSVALYVGGRSYVVPPATRRKPPVGYAGQVGFSVARSGRVLVALVTRRKVPA